MCDTDITVTHWTASKVRALRTAQRMSVREFAAHLGVSARIVCRWEAGHIASHPRPVNEAALDTSLLRADKAAQRRFAQMINTREASSE